MLYPTELWAVTTARIRRRNEKRVVDDNPFSVFGRSTRIRTLDPLVPNQVRYRAALHSEDSILTLGALAVNERASLIIHN